MMVKQLSAMLRRVWDSNRHVCENFTPHKGDAPLPLSIPPSKNKCLWGRRHVPFTAIRPPQKNTLLGAKTYSLVHPT
jgi:hypothetical protein